MTSISAQRPPTSNGVESNTTPSMASSFDRPVTVEHKTTYKSWKKKFRKMKHVFDQRMRESDQLFREEIKAKETMLRLQQENDRLLDMLLDLNDSTHIADKHRVDLGAADILELTQAQEVDGITSSLEKPGSTLRRFQSLLNTAYTDLDDMNERDLPEDLIPAHPPTYFSPSQEQEHLLSLDKNLGLPPVVTRALGNGVVNGAPEAEPAINANVQNPVSVYNWLRKHHPQVFLQDHEASSDKAIKNGDKRGAGKRASIAAAKATPEYVDDDAYAFGYDPPSNGRRKRDDDPGYRPKGGNRALKRKREGDEGPGGKPAKKRPSGGVGKGY